MANKDIKQEAKQAGVYLWQIADALKLQDYRFSRKLRHELPDAEKQKIFTIIEELSKGARLHHD